MSNLISGKEALIVLANGEEVEFQEPVKDKWIWMSAKHLTVENILNHTATYTVQNSPSCVKHSSYSIQFRIKPRTITINGIEVPAPFEPKEGEDCFVICQWQEDGWDNAKGSKCHIGQFGAWRTEEEIKQVVKALRSIFK